MMSWKTLILLPLAALLAPVPAAVAQRGAPPRSDEQDLAREKLLEGNFMPLAVIKRRVEQETGDAAYLGVELLADRSGYRLKYVKNGKVIWFDVNGRTGDIRARSR